MVRTGGGISGQRSKHVDELDGIEFDHVVTVCDNDHETRPRLLGKTKPIHRGFGDLPRLAGEATTQEEA